MKQVIKIPHFINFHVPQMWNETRTRRLASQIQIIRLLHHGTRIPAVLMEHAGRLCSLKIPTKSISAHTAIVASLPPASMPNMNSGNSPDIISVHSSAGGMSVVIVGPVSRIPPAGMPERMAWLRRIANPEYWVLPRSIDEVRASLKRRCRGEHGKLTHPPYSFPCRTFRWAELCSRLRRARWRD